MSDHIALAFGRFAGITKAHQKVLEQTKAFGDKHNAETHIYASHTHDKKKNPLEYNHKIELMKKMMPHVAKHIHHDPDSEVRTPIEMLKKHSDPNKTAHIFAGSDRVDSYKKLFHQYNGKEYHYKDIQVHSTGEREDDEVSGTALRNHATSGNFNEFKKMAPTTAKPEHVKEMYDAVRKKLIKEGYKKDLEQFLFEAKIITEKTNPKKILTQQNSKVAIHPSYENYQIKTHKDSDKSQPDSQQSNTDASAAVGVA
jgi:hypothetical protein